MRTFKIRAGLFLCALAVMMSLGVVSSQAASDKPASAKAATATAATAKKAPAARDVVLTLNNQRKSSVVFFTVIGKDSSGQEPNLLKDALAAGKSIKVKAKAVTGCAVAVAADFEDGSSVEATGIDLCKDPVVKLVD